MEKKKPLILVSNDDGITARGIRVLVEVMSELGEVVVVAPDSPQSGMGHAITIGVPLRLTQTDIFGEILAYECSGTPADCVKIARHHVLKDRMPDLVVSGINHGSNTSTAILYSGTMSAAMEAALEGTPSVGFSLCDFSEEADFEHCRSYVKSIALEVLNKGIPKGITLNVNFPKKTDEPVKGVKLCRQARGFWKEEFEVRYDPYGRQYFWLVGDFINHDAGVEGVDVTAIEQGYVSVVPSLFDLTDRKALAELHSSWEIFQAADLSAVLN